MSDSCDLMVCSLPGSSVHGIFQMRILEWVAISFSRGSSWPRNQIQVSCIAGRFFTYWAMREAQGSKSSVHSKEHNQRTSVHNQGTNHLYIYLYPFSLGAPLSPFYSSRSPQSAALSSLCYIAGTHQLSILHDSVYMSVPISQFIPSPPAPPPPSLNFMGNNNLGCYEID